MYKLEVYNGTQDLTDFYKGAEEKGFYNNHNKTVLIDYINKHENATLFLLYYNNAIVGTSVSHSLRQLGILGKNAHRISARTCVLNNKIDGIRSHAVHNYRHSPMNHWTSQMLTPVCMHYVGLDKPQYISTNTLDTADQKRVHLIWAKIMHDQGYLNDPIELEYKGSFQTFWRVDVEFYLKKLQENIWPETELALDVFLTQLKKV